MDEEKFRKHQVDGDQKSLDGKVRRWRQIRPAIYGQLMPKLMWEYLTTADNMFTNGHFIGVGIAMGASL